MIFETCYLATYERQIKVSFSFSWFYVVSRSAKNKNDTEYTSLYQEVSTKVTKLDIQ